MIPSQSIVVTAASATEPPFFNILAPILAHSRPFVTTAPPLFSSVFALVNEMTPATIIADTNKTITNTLSNIKKIPLVFNSIINTLLLFDRDLNV